MKAQAFKQIIKEAVAEAVREELTEILSQKPQLNESKTATFTSANVAGGGNIREQLYSQMGAMFGYQQPQRNDLKVIDAVDPSTGDKVNPYLAFINDAANNMTAHDRSGLRQLD